ncbi:MAG: cyclopropane-fatty-acyl-phospholipid synthase family protein [Planctomycetota bacterium]
MGLAERGWVPDFLICRGIRLLLAQRLAEESAGGVDGYHARIVELREALANKPIAEKTDHANRQHYEVPAEFYRLSLGRRLKYSGCYWPRGVTTLDQAEDAALALVCEHAELVDGQRVMELGCGWGSLSLWMAEHYPASRITAVSNSASQRNHIMTQASGRGLNNLDVITADINDFETNDVFDRVVSVEMFEHMANHAELMRCIAGWLKDDGKLFVHVFAHRRYAYRFEEDGQSNWMGRHFFTGGIMPSHGYLPGTDEHLRCEADWWQDGTHYQKTAEAWLNNTDANRGQILECFEQTYGKASAEVWLRRWRIFFMACAELWGYRGGKEWGVSHYRFAKQTSDA